MEAWIVIIVIQVAVWFAILALEMWALHIDEEDQVTFSRLVWRMFKRWPKTRYAVGAFIAGVLVFNVWAFIHLVFGPCAFGIC
jgi:hypothetical protein